MLSEIWFVSVVILCISEKTTRGALPFSIVIKSLFPTAFNNNRYLTCYLLFYPIHPALNPVIGKMSQKSLFRTALFSFAIYGLLNFVKYGFFYVTPLVLWVSLYFVTAYVKKYITGFSENKKEIILLLILGISGFVMTSAVLNIFGLKIPAFNGKMLHTASN